MKLNAKVPNLNGKIKGAIMKSNVKKQTRSGWYLKDIIDQIIEVDSLAFENKNKNEQFLLNKKQEFEKMIAGYRGEKLDAAKKHAEQTTDEIESFIRDNERSQSSKIQKMSTLIEENYKKVENDLIQKIFNKLFVLEG